MPDSLKSRFQGLIKANQALAHMESEDVLYPFLLETAQSITHAEGASLLLYDASNQSLHFKLATNDDPSVAKLLAETAISIPEGEGIAGYCAQERKALNVHDAVTDSRLYALVDSLSGAQTRSLLCAPILYQDELIGVLQTVNAKHQARFSEIDLELLQSFADIAAVAFKRSQLLQMRLEQVALETQLATAGQMQGIFIPKEPLQANDVHVFGLTRPAIVVGGDLFDYFQLRDGSILSYICDVSGKGMPAALVAATIWSFMRSKSQQSWSISGLVSSLNNELCGFFQYGMFATLALAILYPESHRIDFISAGHAPPILRSTECVSTVETKNGTALGIVPDQNYPTNNMVLDPGASLLFMTDGILENRIHGFVIDSDSYVEGVVKESGAPPYCQHVLSHLFDSEDRVVFDDATLMEIWRD